MRRLAATVAVAGVAVSGADARQDPSQPRTIFRSSVDLVHLDVSVLDANRRPVRGLGPADFIVLEDGKPQRIAVFNAVDIPDPEPDPEAAAWTRTIAPDVRTNEGIQERRLFLVIVDDATLQSDLNALKNLKAIGRRFVERLGPSDLAAVVLTRDNRQSQDYTSDRSRLLGAIDRAGIGFRDMAPPEIGTDDYAFISSLNVLDKALQVLSTLPDRRKSIVYIGQGVPVDLGQLTPVQPGITAGGSAAMRSSMMSRMKSQMDKVFERAANANVNIYTLDVCGLRVPPGPSQSAFSTEPSLFTTAGYPRPVCAPGLEVEYLRTIAGATGGRAVVDTNDFEPGVENIFVENDSYYLLGYQSTQPGADGKFRSLEVRVRRPGLTVRTRRGYLRESQKELEKRKRASHVTTALAGLLPKSDLPLQMVAMPVAIPGKKEAAVAMSIGVRQPTQNPTRRIVERVDMQVSAFNTDGKSLGSKRLQTDVTIRAGATGLAEYEVLTRLDLKPGRYQIRVAGNVGSLATSGSLYYDVDVPDFRSAALSLSGLALAVAPSLVAGGTQAIRDVLPIVPTAQRQFGPADQVIAFARIYQGGRRPLAPTTIAVRLRDAQDAVVFQQFQEIPPGKFTSDRSANVLVDVPVARLAPGEYLFTLEVTSGTATASRDSRFRVNR
ncbi:MAG TPA: VWA domain-containing protein [Vicinamibacterales bacterium]